MDGRVCDVCLVAFGDDETCVCQGSQQESTKPMTEKKNTPEQIMAWRSDPKLTHIGTWATTRYPEDADRYIRADLHAAAILQARNDALREAAEVLDRYDGAPCRPPERNSWSDDEVEMYHVGQMDASVSWKAAILALIDKDQPND